MAINNGEDGLSVRNKLNASLAKTDALDQGVATTDSPSFAGLNLTGSVTSDAFTVTDTSGFETMITATKDGAVELYYDNDLALSTDVGGTVDIPNGMVANSATFTNGIFVPATGAANFGDLSEMVVGFDGTDGVVATFTANDLVIQTDATERVRIASTGEVTVSNGLTVGTAAYPSTGPLSNRSKIINGAMVIDQRNAGAAAVFAANTAGYTCDRWQVGNYRTVAGNLTVQQSSTAPDGFRKSLLLTNGGAGADNAGDAVFIQHKIEGFNAADLQQGTSSAQSFTISFWVRSSVTGTYGVSVRNETDRSYVAEITINQADTWEFKTLVVPAVTAGTWGIGNGVGVSLLFDLGVGSTNSQASGSWQSQDKYGLTGGTKWYLTNGATFYITGVQLEAGDTATPFEHRSYGQELALCQRYFVSYGGSSAYERYGSAAVITTTTADVVIPFPVQMRSIPTFSYVGAVGSFSLYRSSTLSSLSALSLEFSSEKIAALQATSAGLSAGEAANLVSNNSTAIRLHFSAEL